MVVGEEWGWEGDGRRRRRRCGKKETGRVAGLDAMTMGLSLQAGLGYPLVKGVIQTQASSHR